MPDPAFHEGECRLQAQAGARERLAELGPRFLRDHLPQQHRDFYPLLPFLLVGSVDGQGQPWASVLAGPPGFAHSPEPATLRVEALPSPGDPLAANLRAGAPLGLLGLQPHTRRRNRMNGPVAGVDATGFDVRVGQSFGNCPRYIQAREPRHEPALAGRTGPVEALDELDEEALAFIARTDTLFIATSHPQASPGAPAQHGVDVSHRGGPPGFLRPDGEGGLLLPDYHGNFYFNTLGNLALQPRCGLLFIDVASGDLLQASATATITADPALLAALPGAQRVVRIAPGGALRRRAALPLSWGPAEASREVQQIASMAP